MEEPLTVAEDLLDALGDGDGDLEDSDDGAEVHELGGRGWRAGCSGNMLRDTPPNRVRGTRLASAGSRARATPPVSAGPQVRLHGRARWPFSLRGGRIAAQSRSVARLVRAVSR